METSYYVGAEPKNAVQSEKFWRNRIDAEEADIFRAEVMADVGSPVECWQIYITDFTVTAYMDSEWWF